MNELERAALYDAIEQLDALWDLDAKRGLRDERGGAEYQRMSVAPILRRMLAESVTHA